ncbi:MAG: transposase family protein [Deltaproteobacteria bacterium]|nr:transposase family protein [Deltaproteobacteria bacterium]
MGEENWGRGPRKWAELKFSVVGPLFASPPDQGELGMKLEELSRLLWKHPTNGEMVDFSISTIERWYYAALGADDPVTALMRKVRSDVGVNKAMTVELLEALRLQYAVHPGWSYKLHSDNVEALAEQKPDLGKAPSYSTVRRRMVERGWRKLKVPKKITEGRRHAIERLEQLEVRSFEVSYVHALWHYDGHKAHRKVALPDGSLCVPVALAVLDDRSRLCCHMQWYLVENAENLCHCLRQAYHKRGLPRAEMHDNGKAMRAAEITDAGKRLGIKHRPTLCYSAYQNGKQETFWQVVEGRLMAMLEKVEPLELSFLNRATAAWVELEYNREVNEETGQSPLERMLEGRSVARKAPDSADMRFAFTRRERRRQRRSDGTVAIKGVRFEVPSHLRFLDSIYVRYQSWDLSRAYVVDERTDDLLVRILPVDKARNANSRRRSFETPTDPSLASPPEDADPLPPLMRKYLNDFAATGLPPAYIPKDEVPVVDCDDNEEDNHE